MAKKKTSKHKRKKKPTCPFDIEGASFGYPPDTEEEREEECSECWKEDKCHKAMYKRTGTKLPEDDVNWEDDEPKKTAKPNKKTDKPKKLKTRVKKKPEQDFRSLLIPPELLHKMMDLPPPHNMNCIAVYNFILLTGVNQQTDRPWCNIRFIAGKKEKGKKRKGLKCSDKRIGKALRWLERIKAIKVIRPKRIGEKIYIQIIAYPTKFEIEDAEYLRQRQQDAEDLLDFCNTFTSETNKLEVENKRLKDKLIIWKCEYRKLKCKYKKLKGKLK